MTFPLQAFRPGAPDSVTLIFMGIVVSISVRTFRKDSPDTSIFFNPWFPPKSVECLPQRQLGQRSQRPSCPQSSNPRRPS